MMVPTYILYYNAITGQSHTPHQTTKTYNNRPGNLNVGQTGIILLVYNPSTTTPTTVTKSRNLLVRRGYVSAK